MLGFFVDDVLMLALRPYSCDRSRMAPLWALATRLTCLAATLLGRADVQKFDTSTRRHVTTLTRPHQTTGLVVDAETARLVELD